MHTLVRFTEFSHHVAFLSGITIAHQNPTVILIIVFDTIYEIPSNESVVLSPTQVWKSNHGMRLSVPDEKNDQKCLIAQR